LGAIFNLDAWRHLVGQGSTVQSPFSLTPEWVAIIVAAVLVGDGSVDCDFLSDHAAAFAYFHCLIHNTKEIRPGWRLYRTQATRFFW